MNKNITILLAVFTLSIGIGFVFSKLNSKDLSINEVSKTDERNFENNNRKWKTKNIKIGDKNYEIFVTESLNDMAVGLGAFESIENNQGMLFSFPEENFHSFWMKGMKFDIDIIFLNKDKKIIQIFENAQKDSYINEKNYKSYLPKLKSQYVIEIKAGESKKNGIKPGDVIIFE